MHVSISVSDLQKALAKGMCGIAVSRNAPDDTPLNKFEV